MNGCTLMLALLFQQAFFGCSVSMTLKEKAEVKYAKIRFVQLSHTGNT